ncbi:UDP-N-acetylmuramate--L-alanine ligase [Patescibacteria group bacterium]|nr:UDP-N-acetylmuramate--L-alanine ligase [Patescibacteria group bacterium]
MEFFKDANKVFFVGIGGIGMSALARLFKAHGKEVSGTDSSDSVLIEELKSEGMGVELGHFAEFLPKDTDLVIYSEAIPLSNPELEKAKELGIPLMTYFQALGAASKSYRLVAIAGTHGKTTTTAMLSIILEKAGVDPTVIVGSRVKEFGQKNVRIGQGEIMVVEACEYRRNFLSLHPALTGITNIEVDHLDYFKSEEDYENAFKELADQSEEVIWPDEISEYDGELAVPGYHNLYNAGMAATLARRLGVGDSIISDALKEFKGTWRRFEYRGDINGALVYDDYAHHPTEIMATLQAAHEKHPEARIIAVFQPHQYSRTAALIEQFAESFEDADEVIIPNIYKVRDSEEAVNAVSVDTLVDKISEHHENVQNGQGLEETANYLRDNVGSGDLILVMGAGDVTHLIPMLTEEGTAFGA